MQSKRLDSEPGQGCRHCQDATELEFDFTFAFQPIFNLEDGTVFSYEALVRGFGRGGCFLYFEQGQ